MAEVLPLTALHYNLNAVPSLSAVTAPPYDVIDEAGRAALLAGSAVNVVEIDLPRAPEGGDPYQHAAETLEAWTMEGVLSADREPALWALAQEYTTPDGGSLTRHGIFARVRITDYGPGLIRPHERTHPGPKEDRLRLTRATRHNLSPIFSLYDGADAWPAVSPALDGAPWGEVTDPDGTVHRLWKVEDPAVHAAVGEALASCELLIADGHHRYETARVYRDEIGGEGAHDYVLMNLVSLEDPGLTVFPTHRLASVRGPERQEALAAGLRELFEIEEVDLDRASPENDPGVGVFGYIDGHLRRPFRLRLKDPAIADRALGGKPEPYRRLDSAILESLVLEGILGMSEADISHQNGLGYAKSVPDAMALLDAGEFEVAFFLRPTPVEQVREVAAAGENMPPKSTYFFPKLLSGLLFNPLF